MSFNLDFTPQERAGMKEIPEVLLAPVTPETDQYDEEETPLYAGCVVLSRGSPRVFASRFCFLKLNKIACYRPW